jgi:hypothetical protein
VARKPVSPLTAGWVIVDGSPMFHRSSLRRGESPRVVCQVGRRQSRTASTRRARVPGGRCPASTRRAALTTRARPGHRLRAISTVVLDRDVLEVARHVAVLPCSWLRVGPEGPIGSPRLTLSGRRRTPKGGNEPFPTRQSGAAASQGGFRRPGNGVRTLAWGAWRTRGRGRCTVRLLSAGRLRPRRCAPANWTASCPPCRVY